MSAARILCRNFILTGIVSCLCVLTSPIQAASWQVLHDESMLGFEAYYDKQAFTGRFHQHDTSVRFNPDSLSGSEFQSRIHIASVDTQSRDRDSALRTSDWFDNEQYPLASFQSEQFESLGKNKYRVTGVLHLKGVTKKISIPFEWQPPNKESDTAFMRAKITLDRRDFNIGTGEWAEDDTIGFKVHVVIELKLRPEGL